MPKIPTRDNLHQLCNNLPHRKTYLAADETLGVEHGVVGVHGGLRLGGIADETLGLGKGDVRRCGTITLVVCDDLDAVVLPDTDAGVGGAEVDAYGFSVNLSQGWFGFGLGGVVLASININLLVWKNCERIGGWRAPAAHAHPGATRLHRPADLHRKTHSPR